MPSPLGHMLAGLAVAWGADLVPGRRAWRTAPPRGPWYERAGDGLTVACALLAAAPDLDLLLATHRSFTHSVTAGVTVGLVAAAWGARAGGAGRTGGAGRAGGAGTRALRMGL